MAPETRLECGGGKILSISHKDSRERTCGEATNLERFQRCSNTPTPDPGWNRYLQLST